MAGHSITGRSLLSKALSKTFSEPFAKRLPELLTRLLPTLLIAAFLAGCSSTAVEVEGQFPRSAVVEKLPLRIGVHFDEAFRTHTLAEPIPQRGDWSIAIGAAQVEMFRSVLPSMFDAVVELDDPLAAAAVDAVLLPRVDQMQFAIPFQTKSNFFEIWIRYELTLREPGSERIIASWPLTAYGRTRDAMLDSATVAIEQASVMALRDAAAFLAIDFGNTRELTPWLARVTGPDSAADDRSPAAGAGGPASGGPASGGPASSGTASGDPASGQAPGEPREEAGRMESSGIAEPAPQPVP